MAVLNFLSNALLTVLYPLLRLVDTDFWQAAFHTVLNLTVNGSWAVVILLVIRAVLAAVKAPRKYAYALWAVAAFRFACPVSFRSIFSLLPSAGQDAIPADIGLRDIPRVRTGAAALDKAINAALPAPDTAVVSSINPLQIALYAGSAVWALGLLVLCAAALRSTLRLRRQLKTAAPLPTAQNTLCDPGRSPLWRLANRAPVYTLPGSGTAFVYGVLRPRIYLPERLSPAARRCVLLHERTHLARADHLIKLLAFCLVCVHWFNPLAWLAFVLAEKEMEQSCDEAVLQRLGDGADYAQSLLDLSAHRRLSRFSPVAFGEHDVAARIQQALRYRPPAARLAALTLAAALLLGFGLSADPLVQKTGILIDGRMRQTGTLSQFGVSVPVHQPSLADRTDWEIAAAKGVMDEVQTRIDAFQQAAYMEEFEGINTQEPVELPGYNGRYCPVDDSQYQTIEWLYALADAAYTDEFLETKLRSIGGKDASPYPLFVTYEDVLYRAAEGSVTVTPFTAEIVEIEQFGNGKLVVLADLRYDDDPHTVYRQRYTYRDDGGWKLADISF